MAIVSGSIIEISVSKDGKSWTPLYPPPDYGADWLHNARLIGAYHARRALPEQMAAWKRSLKYSDRNYITIYEAAGEWGRTDLDVDVGAIAERTMASLMTSFAALGATIGQVVQGFAAGLSSDFRGVLIVVERIALRHNLERIGLPPAAACWLAGRWPSWALPAIAWYWLQNRLADEGAILIGWWRRLRG